MKKILSSILALSLVLNFNPLSANAEDIVFGDANCDNQIDIRDITAINQHFLKMNELTDEGIKNIDVDKDGQITLDDHLMLKKYVLKLIDNFEINENAFYGFSSEMVSLSVYDDAVFCIEGISDINRITPATLRSAVSDKYDESFFEENVLYYILNSSSSTSKKYNLRYVERTDSEFILNVEEFCYGGRSNGAMCTTGMFFEVPRSLYNGQTVSVEKSTLMYIGDKDSLNYSVAGFEGVYGEETFKPFASVNTANPKICDNIVIRSTQELRDILKDENSKLLETYNNEFFKSNKLVVIQSVEGYDNTVYTQLPETYITEYSTNDGNNITVMDMYVQREIPVDSVYNSETKFILYSAWGMEFDRLNAIFE